MRIASERGLSASILPQKQWRPAAQWMVTSQFGLKEWSVCSNPWREASQRLLVPYIEAPVIRRLPLTMAFPDNGMLAMRISLTG